MNFIKLVLSDLSRRTSDRKGGVSRSEANGMSGGM